MIAQEFDQTRNPASSCVRRAQQWKSMRLFGKYKISKVGEETRFEDCHPELKSYINDHARPAF
jgi:hypothetical protein